MLREKLREGIISTAVTVLGWSCTAVIMCCFVKLQCNAFSVLLGGYWSQGWRSLMSRGLLSIARVLCNRNVLYLCRMFAWLFAFTEELLVYHTSLFQRKSCQTNYSVCSQWGNSYAEIHSFGGASDSTPTFPNTAMKVSAPYEYTYRASSCNFQKIYWQLNHVWSTTCKIFSNFNISCSKQHFRHHQSKLFWKVWRACCHGDVCCHVHMLLDYA